jgi:hypothetical protein
LIHGDSLSIGEKRGCVCFVELQDALDFFKETIEALSWLYRPLYCSATIWRALFKYVIGFSISYDMFNLTCFFGVNFMFTLGAALVD